jgi:peptide/nickel transport system permease protein
MVNDVAAHNDVSPLTAQQRFIRTLVQHKLAVVSGFYLLFLLLIALVGQFFLIHDPLHIDLSRVLQGPSTEHWLGTDHLGRSTLSRVVVATTVAMKAATLAVGIAIVLGAPLGLLSGYFGGWWDRIAMRIVEAIIALPGLLVAIAILAILGPSLTNAMIALGFAMSTAFFRLMRGAAIEVREALYVDAAQVVGASTPRIVFRHVLPNVTGPLTVQTTLAFSNVLLAEAGLSFIGLGVQPPDASWGVMLATAQNYIYQNPFMAVPPGLMIMFTVLAFNLLGDGLRDALARVDPDAGNPLREPKVSENGRVAKDAITSAGDLLSVRNLEVRFRQPTGDDLAVVSDISFDIPAGKTVGLVGESGCGKTVTAMSVMGLLPGNGYVSNGSINFSGQELTTLAEPQLNRFRGNEVGMIFQEPMTSLNPVYTVKNQIAETIHLHNGTSWADAELQAIALLDRVGIADARSRANDYPHQFSGGMAQRVMIAMALACQPKLLIADEPTTALDVTIQGQVLDLLSSLQQEHGMSILLITHDLGVVADMCDEAVVMYAGQLVEKGPIENVLLSPRHPYTAGLLASIPRNEKRQGGLQQIPGRVPPAWAWPPGCRFHPRCSYATDQCKQQVATYSNDERHLTMCIRSAEIDWESA